MKRQQGVSLINLLVGLLVSAIVIIGMLVIYRNTIQAVVPASEDARSDGERVASILAAQIMLQDAGFGIDPAPAYGAHIRVLIGATRTGGSVTGGTQATPGQAGNAVIWRKRVDDTDLCEGLFADDNGGLWRISSDDSCSNISSGISGEAAPLIQQSRVSEVGAITFSYTEFSSGSECRPFGIGTGINGKLAVIISIENSTGHDIESTTCLANFP